MESISGIGGPDLYLLEYNNAVVILGQAERAQAHGPGTEHHGNRHAWGLRVA